jgi:hypothetical protein
MVFHIIYIRSGRGIVERKIRIPKNGLAEIVAVQIKLNFVSFGRNAQKGVEDTSRKMAIHPVKPVEKEILKVSNLVLIGIVLPVVIGPDILP